MMHQVKFFGSTVMGERGQVVIPAEAREEIGIQSGEKLVVLGNKNRGFVILFKADVMSKLTGMMFRKTKFFDEMFNPNTEKTDDDTTDNI